MGWKPIFFFSGLVLALQVITISARPSLIPGKQSNLDEWIESNMRAYLKAKSKDSEKINNKFTLDKKLTEAERAVKVIKVRKDGTGDFRTITAALKSIPSGNKRRVVVWIGGGVYREKITLDRTKPFVTLYGDKNNMPIITYNGTAFVYGTWYSATVAVESDYFVAVNIAFVVRMAVLYILYFYKLCFYYIIFNL